MRKNRRGAFFVFFSFIIIIIIVTVPLFMNALNALEEQTRQSGSETLRYGLERLEAELNRIQHMCQTLGNDQNLRTLQLLSEDVLDPGASYVVAIKELKQSYDCFARMLTLTDDVGIVLSNHTVIADHRVHMPAESFYGTYLYAEGMSTLEEWVDFIHSSENSYAMDTVQLKRYQQAGARYIVFSFPVTLARNGSTYCYALINEDTLLRMMVQSELREDSHFMLSWGNRTLIDDAAEEASGSTVRIEAQSGSYHLSACLEVDRTLFLRQLSGFYCFGMLFLLVYFTVGTVMGIVYARRNVAPLEKTLKTISEVTQAPELQEDCDDAYVYINRFIVEADKHLQENRLALARQEMQIRENWIERLLRDQSFHASPSDIAGNLFPADFFPCVMCIIQFVDCDRLNQQQFASLQIDAMHAAEQTSNQFVLHFTANYLIVLSSERDFMPQAEHDLLAQMEKITALDIRMGISQPVRSPDAIHFTFVHLRHLLHISDASQTFVYEEPQGSEPSYPNVQYSTRFFEALTRSHLNQALDALNEEYDAFRANRNVTETDVQQFFYCYRHILCQVINADGLMKEIPLPAYDSNASLSELVCEIHNCAASLCAEQINRHSQQMNQREREIINAINSSLSNPDFNINVIMERFSISDRALQSLMRKATGTTFMNYVHERRMERASQLLRNTDMPIQEVYAECGYTSANTFYKAFQRTYAITPKAMRMGGAAADEQEDS